MRQRADWLIHDDAGVVKNLLKLRRGRTALLRRYISLAAQVEWE